MKLDKNYNLQHCFVDCVMHAHSSEVVAWHMVKIKFLSRIKIGTLGMKRLCLFLNFSNFLQAFLAIIMHTFV